MHHPDFYTIKEAAIKANTSPSTLRRLDNRGIFQARRGENNYRYYTTQDCYKLLKLLGERAWFDRRLKDYQAVVGRIEEEIRYPQLEHPA